VDPSYDFQVSTSTPAVSVARGGTAEYSVTFTPVANMTNFLSFGCTGLPMGFLCTFDKGSVVPGTQPVVVKVKVTVPTVIASVGDTSRPADQTWLFTSLFAVFFSAAVPSARKRNRILAVLCVGLLLGACGGGGGNGSGGVTPPPPTGSPSQTPKTYTFNVVGNSGALQRSVPLTLNVQ
jgi:hypothetical protein